MSLRSLRIYAPLKETHPLIVDGTLCWLCGRSFNAGERTTLVPMEADDGPVRTVDAQPVHATCRLRGREINTPMGRRVVERIKDGDGSPFAVLTTDGAQWRDDEVEAP